MLRIWFGDMEKVNVLHNVETFLIININTHGWMTILLKILYDRLIDQ